MPAIQVREFTTGAEMIASYKAIRARREAVIAPPPKPARKPMERPVVVIAASVVPPVIIEPVSQPEPPPAYQRQFLISQIIKAVCRAYGVKENAMMSTRRTANIVRPRHVAIYLAKTLTSHSLPSIGLRFGGRDHTTVLNAIRRIADLRTIDADLNTQLLALELELNPPPDVDPDQLALPFAGEAG